MHSNVTIKNVSWPHFSWPTLYMYLRMSSKCTNSIPGRKFCHRKWIRRPRFPIRGEYFACKPTFKGNLGKLIKKTEVKLRACTQITCVMSRKELVLFLGKLNLCLPNLKSDVRWERYQSFKNELNCK